MNKTIEISRGLYLVPEKRYSFSVDRVEYAGNFVGQEGKQYIFNEVMAFLPIAWGAGDFEQMKVGEKRLKGQSICELVQLN